MTPAQRAYRTFLQSDFWQELSLRVRTAAGKCARCDATEFLQAHHTIYRADWYETQPDDLQVLCRGCHKREHGVKDTWWESLDDAEKDRQGFFYACQQLIDEQRIQHWAKTPWVPEIDPEFLREWAEEMPGDPSIVFHYRQALWWWLYGADDGNGLPLQEFIDAA